MEPIRTSFFVDGSNMAGSLKLLGVRVNDYQNFFNAILNKTTKVLAQSVIGTGDIVPPLRFKRVSWYALSDIDRVDTSTEWFTQKMSEDFFNFKDLSESYRQLVFERTHGERLSIKALDAKAFQLFLGQVLTWYKSQVDFVDGLANFYRAVREKTSFIDIIECGHWKVDFVNRVVNEKELDTRMAVDIVTVGLDSDVILLMSGDADFIPSVRYVKQQGKQVGIVQLTDNTRQSIISNRLKMVADFVVYLDKSELP